MREIRGWCSEHRTSLVIPCGFNNATLKMCFLLPFQRLIVSNGNKYNSFNISKEARGKVFFLRCYISCIVNALLDSFEVQCLLSSRSDLTGQAKLNGKTILDLSFLAVLFKENVFPPNTGVDPAPKLHGPAADTLDWYSFRHTLKKVSHSSLVHFRSAVFRDPSQHWPFSNSPFRFCIDMICNSNCPDASDTCWKTNKTFNKVK